MKIIMSLAFASLISWQANTINEALGTFEQLLPQYIEWAHEVDKKGIKIGIP
jgi:hypothetical protein